MEYIYVLFSRTETKMGRLIRLVTGSRYNHVSIALREDLSDCVSFARRYYHAPFYGGFIRESIQRYYSKGHYANVAVCKVPVSEKQYTLACSALKEMQAAPLHYIYDLFAAVTLPFGLYRKRNDAYTCLHFAVEMLGLPRAESIDELLIKLSNYEIFEGSVRKLNLPDDPCYLKKIPLLHATALSFGMCKELFRRPIQKT